MNGPLTSCDTFAALATATRQGRILFAKNSDRPHDERQKYVLINAAQHAAGARVKVQYLELPQAERTYKVIGAQPLWLWGFEHGVNEHGLAIGNEAVYTRATAQETGLLGMDLVRLALERTKNARQAVTLMGELIEEHGIGGSAREHANYPYDNGFLICDPQEVWHLETVGRHWVARQLAEPVMAISNEPSIGAQWDTASAGIEEYLVSLGGERTASGQLDFAAAVLDRERPRGQATCRRARGMEVLTRDQGHLEASHMLALLRDHYDGTPLALWNPAASDIKSICMHTTPYHQVKTAGSMVADLLGGADGALVWLAIGQPCQRAFLPFTVGEITTQAQLDQVNDLDAQLEDLFDESMIDPSNERIGTLRSVESEALAAVAAGGATPQIRARLLEGIKATFSAGVAAQP